MVIKSFGGAKELNIVHIYIYLKKACRVGTLSKCSHPDSDECALNIIYIYI